MQILIYMYVAKTVKYDENIETSTTSGAHKETLITQPPFWLDGNNESFQMRRFGEKFAGEYMRCEKELTKVAL